MMFLANVPAGLIGASTIVLIAISSFRFTKELKQTDNKVLRKRDEENREYSEMHHKSKMTYLFGLQKENTQKMYSLFDQELVHRKHYIFVNHFMYPISLIIEAIGIYAILYYALNLNLTVSLRKYLLSFILYQTV